ncbi:phage tail assembly protein [Erythrobacter sp. EC-HK427]|uniref:phage tail assembly protein n=1 Tax=Erythrobacter sp. EC-HK427 TaxID=2038396 RepID=UPI0012567CDB|nr:phage tail assembly protein [Erythrobacter sp. EC-HK427]VVT07299.1 putative phage tail protein [Erythrobacter sp. EC-HK427]
MTDKSPAPPASDTKAKNFITAKLIEPITRGEITIDQLTIRKPKAGELRGLVLSDVIGLDITALLKLIPRVTEPALTPDECQDLDPADLTEIGGGIRSFFMTRGERELMDRMIAEHQPKT